LELGLPPLSEQVEIAEAIASIRQRSREEHAFLANLESLKRAAAEGLLKGIIRVPPGAAIDYAS
jgi:hypothetical protein